ncbi:MAG: phospho-N-acetylmuramoyl-pentapeptide-transferase [Bacteroidales bacterium]|nr:phospho-N-acetylmuramoyl-pentapeptide-transferase [Bacteroidales bacterium]
MLYYLFNYLQKCNFPGAGVFNYVTFRAAAAVILALIISVWFGNYFINLLKRKKVVETQRDVKTDPYNTAKKGVPTMGGVIIITAILIPVLLVGKLHSIYTILMIVTTLILGTLGFADDYIKTFKKNKDGLKPKVKLGGQILLGLIVGLTLRFSPAVQINETVSLKIEDNKEVVVKSPDVKSTKTTIPFLKNHNLNYADLFRWAGPKWMYNLAWVFLVLLTVFIVAAVSNGSNLNDGMDGMASGNSAIIGITLVVLAYISSNAVTASHFNLMYIPGSEELVVFLAAFVGALIGFLWFNSYPAQIFMGDTGSLTIGGIIAVSAIIMHKELLLPLLCGVFLFEILSDLDVKLFLKRGKKHRIWKKGPLHDHFRTSYSDFKKAWPDSTVTFKGRGEGYNTVHHEVKITLRFWIVTILLAAFTLITFKIR